MTFKLAHLSDTHLGYEAYRALTASGHNQRGMDIVKAFSSVCKDIIAADPALVIHSGDAHDRPKTDIVYMLVFQQQLQRLAGIRKDGTRRQVVVISGNHDQPRSHREACFLELFSGIPGVHIVTNKYDVIQFTGEAGSKSEGCDPSLRDVEVHCLPHDQLKVIDFDTVHPQEGKTSILTSHGVAGGSDLFYRSLGREYPIPTDVLGRAWDYVALGHWHKQGPVPLVSTGAKKEDPEVGRVWYAGSTENMSFRDLRDNGTQRGYLLVDVLPGEMPKVERRYVPIRSMFRLPVLDAQGLTPEEITQALRERIKKAPVAGAVVGQIVEGVSRDLWSLVDVAGVRDTASEALHYEISVKYASSSPTAQGSRGLGDLGVILEERAKSLLAPSEVPPALAMARDLLGSALQDPQIDVDKGSAKDDKSKSTPPKDAQTKGSSEAEVGA